MQPSRWFVTVMLVASAAALSGCLPRAAYQSPRVLSEGEYSFGAGLARVTMVPGVEVPIYTGSAFFRSSTWENSDAGVALHFTRANGVTVAGDSRKQLTEGSFLVTGRVGGSLAYWWGPGQGGFGFFQFALEPGLLLGSDRVWGILSCPLSWLLGSWVPFPAPYVGLGARIGNRLVLLPELGCNLEFGGEEEGLLIGCLLGLGVQYEFGLAQDSDNLFGVRRAQPVQRPPI